MNCESALTDRSQIKFCSNQCQSDFRHRMWVRSWKAGEVNGNIGVSTRNISTHLRRYLTDKFGDRCSKCGWSKNIQ